MAGTVDRESLLVEEIADAADQQDLVVLVIPAIAAALYWFQLREFLLPISEHVGFDRTKVADLADGEIPFGGDRRQLRLSGPLHKPRGVACVASRTSPRRTRRATQACVNPVCNRRPFPAAKAHQCGKGPAWFAASTMAFSF